jgi:ABC-2 type transport system permease protein
MKRYLQLYKTFIKSCLIREMEFRLNFFLQILLTIFWAASAFFTVYLIFSEVGKVGTWDRSKMILLTTVFYFSNAFIKATLYDNINRIPDYIRRGDLDFLLTKPVSLRFFVSTRFFSFSQFPRIIIFIIMIIVQAHTLNSGLSIVTILFSFALMFLGIFGMYNFLFIISCIAFWKPRVWNLFAIVSELESWAEYPTDIYRGFLKTIILCLPLAGFATIPTKFFLGEGTFSLFVLTFSTTLFFFLLSFFVWKKGLKHYESASS